MHQLRPRRNGRDGGLYISLISNKYRAVPSQIQKQSKKVMLVFFSKYFRINHTYTDIHVYFVIATNDLREPESGRLIQSGSLQSLAIGLAETNQDDSFQKEVI